jgi:CubicO group peptidase (beta-lactamase class C family)
MTSDRGLNEMETNLPKRQYLSRHVVSRICGLGRRTFPITMALATALLLTTTGCSDHPVTDDSDDLPRVSPETVGYSAQKLEEAAQFAEQIGSSAVMALHNGRIFFEWGSTEAKYKVHSIRKPFLGAIFGIHVARGEISLSATLEELNIDDIPPALTAEEKQATVRHLLQSRSGVYHVAAAETPQHELERPERGSHPPGTHFYYNNWDFNVLGTIFEQETGLDLCEAFHNEIASPIGMQDFVVTDCSHSLEPLKSMHPAYPFRMTTRDMARFGLLYQRDGRWDGVQIVPANWIEESWTPYSVEDAQLGFHYGYLWAIAPGDETVGQMMGGHDMYFHTGLAVHVLAVIPDLNLVLINRFDTDQPFSDPGDNLGDLIAMIVNARD